MKKYLFKKSIVMIILGVTVLSTSVPTRAAQMDGIDKNGTENVALKAENQSEDDGGCRLEEESGIIDTQKPELKNITLSATSVKAPGSIEVTMEATDDISGVRSGSIEFCCDLGNYNYDYCSVELNRTYWNSTTYQRENYEDGKLHGTMKIKADATIGKYKISGINISDNAGNTRRYETIPDNLKNLSFRITDGQETATPLFESISLSTQSVSAPGTINVVARLAQNNEEISSISIDFESKSMSERSGRENISAYLLQRNDDEAYTGTIELGEYTYPDEYKFHSIWVSYRNGASRSYYVESQELKNEIKELSFKVSNDKLDKTAPEIKNIILGADSVSVPGAIDITVEATDDMSGAKSVSLSFVNKKDDKSVVIYGSATDKYYQNITDYTLVKYEDGKLHGQITLDQYTASGEFVLDYIIITDNAGNYRYYSNSEYSDYKIPVNLKDISFKIVNDGESTNVTTSTGSAGLLNDIRNAADNAVISVDITPNPKISKEVFDLIKGTNKTLLLNSDSIQWVFKGSDITGQTKDIDLSGIESGKINYDPSKEYYIGDIPALSWKLGNNGELPGKATVRFVTYLAGSRDYLGTEGLYVYFFDSKTGELSPIASNLSITNGNNIEFDITCCKEGVILVTKGMAKTDSAIPEGPNTWQSKSGVEGFVYRLYNVALSRDAEDAGLADWTGRLNSKEEDAAKVAWGFFFSEEFKNKNYTDAQFVEMMYRTMFGRKGDNEGKQYWISMLENGASREYVYHGFAESQEFSNLCNDFGVDRGSVTLGLYRDKNIQATGFIARLYTKMLGRKFDEDGLEDWCKKYLTKENTIEEIASHGFLHSQELANQNLDDTEFVTRMYQTFLNREPEEEGLKDWVGRLERGEVTRDTLVYGFTNSPEFGNLKAEYNLP